LINPKILRHGFLFADAEKSWSTNVMTETLATENATRMSFHLTWRDYHHITKMIDREFIRDPDIILNDYDEDDEDEDASKIHDLIQTYFNHMTEMKYERLTNLTRNMSPESMNLFRDMSDKWQRWLNLMSRQSMDDDEEMKMKEQEQDESIETQLLKIIHDLYDPSKNWRSSEQEKIVVAIVNDISSSFIIFPTEFEKSSTFLLSIKLKNTEITIVIISLITLGNNILKTCQKTRIDYIFYDRSLTRMTKIVIVMTDMIVEKEFTQYANEIKLMGKLDRIVWDEIHKWQTDTFHSKLMENNDWSLRIQEVFLTITSSPYLQKKFMQQWKIHNETMIKIPNRKSKVRYTIKIFKNDDFK
jgi:hypothetical protein